jgi:translocation protein SEC66
MWPFDLVDWVMLAVPIAYIVILIGSLSVFSNLYRKRQMASAAALEPWFPAHLQRNIYLSLLHQDDPKVPDNILKAALLRRATEDIHRIVRIRNEKQALQVLLQRGSVGDDLWQRFQRAEKEMEEELRDVVQEVRLISDIPLHTMLITFLRPTPSHPTGAKQSSNPPPRWRRTHTSASAWARL